MRVIGLISGTSHDGIDAAAVEFRRSGDTLVAALLVTDTTPYPASLRDAIIEALPPAQSGLETVCRLDAEIGHAFAAAAQRMLDMLPEGGADLICSHGQTMFHGVRDGRVWGTLQLGQAAWISEATGLPVISDLRTRDVAAGGQGAPLVPILDRLVLAGASEPVAALNLGGIANATILRPGTEPIAYDIGPANALIDAAVWLGSDGRLAFDEDGRVAARGTVDEEVLARLLEEPYYRLPPPKSTGKELFNGDYLGRHAGALAGDDLVATVTALSAEVVARGIREHDVGRVLVSGGGVRNATLMAQIVERTTGVEVQSTDAIGLPADAKEAVAFALIGWLTAHGLPGSVAACTGAEGDRVLGSIMPGAQPWSAQPDASMPLRLVMDGISPGGGS